MRDSVIHVKATLEEIQELTLPSLRMVITEGDMNRFNVSFDHFQPFIQEVPTAKIIHKVILLYEEKAYEEVNTWKENTFPPGADVSILVHQKEDDIMKQLHRYEKKEQLIKLEKHQDFQMHPWSVVNYYEVAKTNGFYTKDVGYLGGMVSKKFQDQYGNAEKDSFAFKEDFEFVYSCIGATPPYDSPEDVDTRRKNFERNFLDNFEPGVSYLLVE